MESPEIFLQAIGSPVNGSRVRRKSHPLNDRKSRRTSLLPRPVAEPQEISSSSLRSRRIGSSSRRISMGRRGYGFCPGLFFAPIGLSSSLPFRQHLSLSLKLTLNLSLSSLSLSDLSSHLPRLCSLYWTRKQEEERKERVKKRCGSFIELGYYFPKT